MVSDGIYIYLAVGAVLLALLPAILASRKGRSFLLWWAYGALILPAALPHALLLRDPSPDTAAEAGVRCPGCDETLPRAAIGCRQCGWAQDSAAASRDEAEPAAARAGGEDGPLWNDETFARISKMGPGPAEPDRPPVRTVAVALTIVALVGGTTVALYAWPDRRQDAAAGPSPPPAAMADLAERGSPADMDAAVADVKPPRPSEPPVLPPSSMDPPPVPPPPSSTGPTMPRRPEPTPPNVLEPPSPEPPPGGASIVRDGGTDRLASTPESGADAAGTTAREPAPSPSAAPAPPQSGSPRGKAAPDGGADGKVGDVSAVGDLVVWLQRRLVALGYFEGPVDGRADARTRAAIRSWQRSRQMSPTGRIDQALILSLRRADTTPEKAENLVP